MSIQSNIWTNDDAVHWRIYASHGLGEFHIWLMIYNWGITNVWYGEAYFQWAMFAEMTAHGSFWDLDIKDPVWYICV